MDSFRCLVIRGPCDYADSHKFTSEYEEHKARSAPLPAIAEVTFEGNKAVLITDLEHAINDVACTPYSQYTFKFCFGESDQAALRS